MQGTQLFTYDTLNSFSTAETAATNRPLWQGDTGSIQDCWGEQFNYDPWGNLTGISPVSSAYTGCTQENWSMSPTAKNQLQDTNNDYVYDSAGNLIQPGPIGGPYVFDAENRLTSAGGLVYLYDGDGKRVAKAPANAPTQPNYLYWYGTGSQILEETNGAGTYLYSDFYFNGMLLARGEPDNWVDHFFADALGNTRVVYGDNDPDGGSSDYYPFGGERPASNGGVNVPFKFTGKERDSESGLDNFLARFDSSNFGRFLSPDPYNAGASLGNPQSWNAYAYAENDPVNGTDPEGLAPQPSCTLDGGSIGCQMVTNMLQQGAAAFCPFTNCLTGWQFVTNNLGQNGLFNLGKLGSAANPYVPGGGCAMTGSNSASCVLSFNSQFPLSFIPVDNQGFCTGSVCPATTPLRTILDMSASGGASSAFAAPWYFPPRGMRPTYSVPKEDLPRLVSPINPNEPAPEIPVFDPVKVKLLRTVAAWLRGFSEHQFDIPFLISPCGPGILPTYGPDGLSCPQMY